MDPGPYTLKELVWLWRGRRDLELELYYADADDAWERDSRVLAMIYNLTETVGCLISGKPNYKKPDDFNDSLKGPEDSAEADGEDDYPWAEPEEVG